MVELEQPVHCADEAETVFQRREADRVVERRSMVGQIDDEGPARFVGKLNRCEAARLEAIGEPLRLADRAGGTGAEARVDEGQYFGPDQWTWAGVRRNQTTEARAED